MGIKQLTDGTECTETVQRIKNPRSETTRLARRDTRSGMFLKKVRSNPSAKQITAAITAKLTQSEDGEDCTVEKIVDSMADLAQNPTEKTASASVKAAELLLKIVVPKEEVDRKQPITIILPQMELMHAEIIVEGPKERLKPSWLEAEVISTNPPQLPQGSSPEAD